MTKIIFDISPTGTGKSYVSKKVSEWFGTGDGSCKKSNRIVLLCASPRQHPELLKYFKLIEGRRGEIINSEGEVIPANCDYYDLANKLVDKGFTAEKICGQCERKMDCEFKRNQWSAGYYNIIASPGSYRIENGDIALLDEGATTIPLLKTLTIKRTDVVSYIRILKAIEKELVSADIDETELENFQAAVQKVHKLLNEYLNAVNMIEKGELEEGYSYFESLTLLIGDENITIKAVKYINDIFKEYQLYLRNSNLCELPENFSEILIRVIKFPDRYGYYFVEGEQNIGDFNIKYLNTKWEELIAALRSGKMPFLYVMDATPDAFLLQLLKAKGFEYEIVGYDIKRVKPKIIQVVDKYNSKTHSHHDEKFKAFLLKLAGTKKKTIGIITFSNIEEELVKFLKDNKVSEKFILGHWGNDNRATNKYQDCDTLLIWGRFVKNPKDTCSEFKCLSYHLEEFIDPSTVGKVIMHNEKIGFFTKYYNEYSEGAANRELKQAVGRICRGDYKPEDSPEIYIFTSYLYSDTDEIKTYSDIVDYQEYATDKQLARDKRLKKDPAKLIKKIEGVYEKILAEKGKVTVRELAKKAKIATGLAQKYLKNRRGET